MRNAPLSSFRFLFPFLFSLSQVKQIDVALKLRPANPGIAHNMLTALHFQGRIWPVRVFGARWDTFCPFQNCDILEYLYFCCDTEQKQAEDLLSLCVSRWYSGTLTWGSEELPVQWGQRAAAAPRQARGHIRQNRDSDCQIVLHILVLWCENRLLHTFYGTDFSSICACQVSKEGGRTIISALSPYSGYSPYGREYRAVASFHHFGTD